MSESAIVLEKKEIDYEKVIEELKEGIKEKERLEKELEALKDKHLRLQAEFENFRKRKAKEAEEVREYAGSKIILEFLPVIDHFELALADSHNRTDPNWWQGIELILKQFIEILRYNGVSEVAPLPGEKFDHSLHEALGEEVDNNFEPETIVRMIRKGYKLKNRLIRPAQVIISASKKESAPVLYVN